MSSPDSRVSGVCHYSADDRQGRLCIEIQTKAFLVSIRMISSPELADSVSVPLKRIQTSPSNFLLDPEIQGVRETLDAVVSASGLHWVGDIVGQLTSRCDEHPS